MLEYDPWVMEKFFETFIGWFLVGFGGRKSCFDGMKLVILSLFNLVLTPWKIYDNFPMTSPILAIFCLTWFYNVMKLIWKSKLAYSVLCNVTALLVWQWLFQLLPATGTPFENTSLRLRKSTTLMLSMWKQSSWMIK